MRLRVVVILLFSLIVSLPSALAQTPTAVPSRDDTREKLRGLLETAGTLADVNTTFKQSTKQPYNFVASMSDNLANVDSLEVIISVTLSDTIGFRVYPHYKGGYINLRKATDGPALMHKMLTFSDLNFLFWGADATDDIFCGYTFTLESGFPDKAIVIVLRSIRNTDKFVGELRPFVDGPATGLIPSDRGDKRFHGR